MKQSVQDREIRFSAMIQHLLLSVLQTMQDGLSTDTTGPLKGRVAATLNEMATGATQQNKWNLADGFRMVEAIGHSEWKLLKYQILEVNSQIQNLDMRNGNLGNQTVNLAQCLQDECVEISLVSMALETSWMTCTSRDEM